MKIIIVCGLAAILAGLAAAFWWVKGQPVDWDGFTRRRGWGAPVMHNPGPTLKKTP